MKQSVPGVGGRWKISAMQQCLGLACFQLDKELLLTAGCIAIHQDVRALVLLVRFSACTPGLDVFKGVLGSVALPNGNHHSLIAGTASILEHFCNGDANAVATIKSKVVTHLI
jgi:hypothetical protein